MQEQVISCFGSCLTGAPDAHYFENAESAKRARLRDKQLTKLLHKHHKEDLKRLKLLLLGTGESGKSTITKQMRIIHINGFTNGERMAKIVDIIKNIRESILSIIVAMQQLQMSWKRRRTNQAQITSLLTLEIQNVKPQRSFGTTSKDCGRMRESRNVTTDPTSTSS